MSIAPPLGETQSVEAARLRALDRVDAVGAAPEERFDRITRTAQRLFGVHSVLLTLIDHDRLWHKSAQGVDAGSAPHHDTFCNDTMRRLDPLIVEDAASDQRYADNPYVLGEPHVRFYAGQAIEDSGGHRVGTLSLVDARPRTFSSHERARLARLAGWAWSELQSTAERDRDAEVQRGLQPHASALLVPGYELAGVCLAARTVGGDLLDWYVTPGGDVVVTLGDVMGKGIGAAIMMATVRGALRTSGRSTPPSEAMRDAAGALEEDLRETGTYVTLCHARLDPASGDLAFADVGHGLSLIVRADGRVLRPPNGGLPLGIDPEERWTEFSTRLLPGDTMVSFSDGLIALYDGALRTAYTEITRVTRASTDAAAIVDHFAALARRSHLTDDVTLFALRRSA